MRYDYRKIKTEKVEVRGIVCEFDDMRIDRATVPDGKYLYEVAGDDDSGAEPARVGILLLLSICISIISWASISLCRQMFWALISTPKEPIMKVRANPINIR